MSALISLAINPHGQRSVERFIARLAMPHKPGAPAALSAGELAQFRAMLAGHRQATSKPQAAAGEPQAAPSVQPAASPAAAPAGA
ncbi:MAG: hypothetical protein AB7U97_02640 [Pirellulales bacterium]